MRTSLALTTGAIAITLLAGCTVNEVKPPSVSGPSTMATSISLQAQPDSILQDGGTASVIALVRGPDGQPASNLDLRVGLFVNGVAQEFGTIVPKSLRTGSDGTARFTYTAPPRPADSVGTGTRVTVKVMPVGSDFRGEVSHEVDINVIPPGVILPPNGAPVPLFVVTPTPAQTRQTLLFDASSSTDEGVVCGSRCTYNWTFGDGTTGTGVTTTHEYRAAAAYSVTLSVTDQRGTTASLTQSINVAATTPPTATLSFSPTTPRGGDTIFFSGSQSKAGTADRRLVSYEWDFGDGTTGTGVTVSKTYSPTRTTTYNVTLKVTDDLGIFTVSSPTAVTITVP